jgi:hypothetical protein
MRSEESRERIAKNGREKEEERCRCSLKSQTWKADLARSLVRYATATATASSRWLPEAREGRLTSPRTTAAPLLAVSTPIYRSMSSSRLARQAAVWSEKRKDLNANEFRIGLEDTDGSSHLVKSGSAVCLHCRGSPLRCTVAGDGFRVRERAASTPVSRVRAADVVVTAHCTRLQDRGARLNAVTYTDKDCVGEAKDGGMLQVATKMRHAL